MQEGVGGDGGAGGITVRRCPHPCHEPTNIKHGCGISPASKTLESPVANLEFCGGRELGKPDP